MCYLKPFSSPNVAEKPLTSPALQYLSSSSLSQIAEKKLYNIP